ncbi:hypothetical protein CRG98_002194 [Punica granatum]|uniref:Uncharacterized protein n=1 Tax=Punica granatum TaxID=22663 RepID=A0A2I0L9R5_PUNGR|nr:hypothetical protein CRG98_002194 [Punica granatum]
MVLSFSGVGPLSEGSRSLLGPIQAPHLDPVPRNLDALFLRKGPIDFFIVPKPNNFGLIAMCYVVIQEGLGPPISHPDPSTEVTSVLCRRRRPRWRDRGRRLAAPNPKSIGDLRLVPGRFRVRSLQLAIPTPPPRSAMSFVGVGDLGGGVGVADWRPSSPFDFRLGLK